MKASRPVTRVLRVLRLIGLRQCEAHNCPALPGREHCCAVLVSNNVTRKERGTHADYTMEVSSIVKQVS